MSTTTQNTPAVIAFSDYARMQSDEALIFAAHALEGYPDRATGKKYWAIISILIERHPGSMEKALATGGNKQSAIRMLLPHIAN